MKTLILVLFILFSGVVNSQTYKADSLVYYSSVYNEKPDTAISNDITIVIEKGYITIRKYNAFFRARIVDTLPEERVNFWLINKVYLLKVTPKYDGEEYDMQLIVAYAEDQVVSMGLLHGVQLFIYRIVNQLIDGGAKQKQYEKSNINTDIYNFRINRHSVLNERVLR